MVRFKLKPGNAAEVTELIPLLGGVSLNETSEVLGDKAFDSNSIRNMLASNGIIATIPPKANRKNPPNYDAESYKTRHLVENVFADAKQFRGIATRYHKLATTFSGIFSLVAWYLATKQGRRGPSPYQKQ